MKSTRIATALAIVALGAGLASIWGCSKKAGGTLLPNQPPTVRLTNAPFSQTTRYYYSITLNWIGFDPDGRISHYLIAVDPPFLPGSDTLWEVTSRNQITRSFNSSTPDPTVRDTIGASDFHVFVVKAVDNRGAVSPPESRAFFSFTEAPSCQIDNPRPSDSRAFVTPAVLISWSGEDRDGVFTKKPVKYKYKLLNDQTEVTLATAFADRDSVRRYYAPRNWVGWDSTTADTTQKQLTNLVPDQEYIFCVVAFDEAGAYSPRFTLTSNMLYFRVTFAGRNNPRIGLFNEFFNYLYPSGSYQPNNPAIEIPIEIPAARSPADRITFNWFAIPNPGSAIRSYRWAVNIVDLNDETPRSDEATDLTRWSAKSVLTTTARIGPYFNGGETHRFYLETEDINGLKSLGVVRFTIVRPSFDRPLGIFDDTRLLTDEIQINTACLATVNRPKGPWPTAAELDTFLYAKGGVPWKCYPPPNNISRPGLFAGYDFDTVGTRLGIPDATTRLSELGRFRHVIWLVDGQGALNFKTGTDRSDPLTSLRYMNASGKSNTLAAYIRFGGKVWLVGGGGATASLINYDRTNNNTTQPTPTLTFSFTNNELIPGRFVYDQFKWQSELKQFKGAIQLNRSLGRFRSNPGIYSLLPASMLAKSLAAGDTFPPNRAVNFADFYQTQFDIEFLSLPNPILEDADPGPRENFISTLDTLFGALGAALPLPPPQTNPTMTYYRGLPGQDVSLILSGFNLWNYRKTQCKQMVDFVLQQLWGLFPRPAPPAAARPVPFGEVGGAAVKPWSPPTPGRAVAAPVTRAPAAPVPVSDRVRQD